MRAALGPPMPITMMRAGVLSEDTVVAMLADAAAGARGSGPLDATPTTSTPTTALHLAQVDGRGGNFSTLGVPPVVNGDGIKYASLPSPGHAPTLSLQVPSLQCCTSPVSVSVGDGIGSGGAAATPGSSVPLQWCTSPSSVAAGLTIAAESPLSVGLFGGASGDGGGDCGGGPNKVPAPAAKGRRHSLLALTLAVMAAKRLKRPVHRKLYTLVAAAAFTSVMSGYALSMAAGAMFIAKDELGLSNFQVEVRALHGMYTPPPPCTAHPG